MVCRPSTARPVPNIWEPHIFLSNLSWLRFQVFYYTIILDRLWASWVSRHPVDSHFVKKINLFFVCCLARLSRPLNTFWTATFQLLAENLMLDDLGKSSEIRALNIWGLDSSSQTGHINPSRFLHKTLWYHTSLFIRFYNIDRSLRMLWLVENPPFIDQSIKHRKACFIVFHYIISIS